MNSKQQKELDRQADVLMVEVWRGKDKYFDEIVDAIASSGIKYEVNKKAWTISVDRKDYSQANGILMDLNECLEAGW
tara:strand:+ start:140 stop:370 length:231 start_codon:yes stop_codon:yes gene_type:complete